MGTNSDHEGDRTRGPTLYLESGTLESDEAFCTEVFDDAVEGEYRVVQLTSSQSFESLRDALDVQLERINDPSEAAVIITTPQSDGGSTRTVVGEQTPLYGFQVDPQDLTGISIVFSRLIERWDEIEGSVKICLRDIESLLPYHDTDLIYRFLNTILATLQGAGADVHVHFHPAAADEQTRRLFESLFDRVVEPQDSPLESVADAESPTETGQTAATTANELEEGGDESDGSAETVTPTTMSDDEIDTFLGSEGYGVLAFDGESPYAIPMSYGYDADERVLYIHLAAFDGSEKQARLERSPTVSFVVSRYARPDQWRSVVIDGTLSPLSYADVRKRDVLEVFASSKLASVDVFSEDTSELSFEWYVLEPSSMSGRQSATSL